MRGRSSGTHRRVAIRSRIESPEYWMLVMWVPSARKTCTRLWGPLTMTVRSLRSWKSASAG